MTRSIPAAIRSVLSARAGVHVPVVLALGGLVGAVLGALAGHLAGRWLPVTLLTGGLVSAAVGGSVVAAHHLLGSPGIGRAGARVVLWGTLALALGGQAAREGLDYLQFRRAAVASLVAGPGAPADPDLYLDVVLLAETGQPGFRGYVLSTFGVDRDRAVLEPLRLRVLGHLIALALTAALAGHFAQARLRTARCSVCRRRAERCVCSRIARTARLHVRIGAISAESVAGRR